MSISKFVSPGFLLSVDLLLVSFVNWIYWLLVSKITSAADVGQATSVYSFTVLTSAITLLGLEYSLVRRSSSQRSHILGTSLLIVSLTTAASIPVLLYFLNSLYDGTLHEFLWLAAGLVIFSSQRYVLRYALLGILDARTVLVVNSLGAALQLVSGCALVSLGYGATGILISFLANLLFITSLSFIVARRSFEFRMGELRYCKEILKDALANMPTPVAKTAIFSLSVVLLASYGINQSEVGVFYIALMLSIIAGGFAGNIAFMAIPASSATREDLSSDSIRIGLSMTSPLIVALLVAPRSILGLIGPEYTSADLVLTILSAGIFPYIIVINAISKFNNLGRPRIIIIIGSIHVISFLLTFSLLVPQYGIIGAAVSIIISSIASAVPSIIWSEREVLSKFITKSLVSIMAGLVVGYSLLIFGSIHQGIVVLASVIVVMLSIFGLRNTSPAELIQIVKSFVIR
jgi:O-antigen/teichoic acid export membrane protein